MDTLLDKITLIEDLEDQIRTHINDGVLHNQLLRDKEKWWMLCSGLDVLGDTTVGFRDYLKNNFPESTGLQYIAAYGIMQCFILQQDSVKHLYEVFDVQWDWHTSFKEIRRIRNASIGHTVLNNEGGRKEQEKNEFNNFISRITIQKAGFDLLRYSKKNKDTVYFSVKIYELADSQFTQIIKFLKQLIREIVNMEDIIKEQFRDEKLVDLLPISYWFEKIHSIYDLQNRDFAITALDAIHKAYHNLISALEKRLLEDEYWFNELDDYILAVDLMKQSLISNDDRRSRILNYYLTQKNNYFKSLMIEIDQKYT